MVEFGMSESLQREVRKGSMTEIGIPTWTLAEEALRSNDIKMAEKLIGHGVAEMRGVHDVVVKTTAEWIEFVVKNMGEEHAIDLWKCVIPDPAGIKRLSAAKPVERIYQFTEVFRGHSDGPSRTGEMTVLEEADRFVIVHNPCGSGGVIRRTGQYGRTKRAYPWSWGKTGVHYYCTHCCLFWELTAISVCGYPLRIHENVDKPLEPCIQYIYKRPDLIPEIYFTRLGLKRDPAKFS